MICSYEKTVSCLFDRISSIATPRRFKRDKNHFLSQIWPEKIEWFELNHDKKGLAFGKIGKAVTCRSCKVSFKPKGAKVQPAKHWLLVATAAPRIARSTLLSQ
jgi:hypothetical protein